MICPWFGQLPGWFDQYLANIELLKPLGYDWLITTNLNRFRQRVGDLLGIKCPIVPGTGKVHDYRASFGVLFQDETKEYDYYGHTDFDCVYGRPDHFMNDAELCTLDIWSNHVNYICGPWTLYRNGTYVRSAYPEYAEAYDHDSRIAGLFMRHRSWQQILERPDATGWVEFQDGYTGIVDHADDAGEIIRKYTMYQTRNLDDFGSLEFDLRTGSLYEGGAEVMMAHFRRTKAWPLHKLIL